jgi:hypothetical protein
MGELPKPMFMARSASSAPAKATARPAPKAINLNRIRIEDRGP